MRVLVTGFGPFADVVANPSERIARALDGRTIGAARVTGLALPTSFARAKRAVAERLAEHDVVILLGVAEASAAFRVERVGRNHDEARVPDVDGARRVGPIDVEAPEVLPVRIDVEAAIAAIDALALPVEASESAGAYVCNHVLFSTLLEIERRGAPVGPGAAAPVEAGFLHVPPCPETHAEPRPHAIALERQIAAVEAVVARLSLR